MFRDRIRDGYERLSPGYRKLADFIVNYTLDAAFLTATELARRVEVDPATVVRFAQDLGYSGYRELSQEIKQHVHARITTGEKLTEPFATPEEHFAALLGKFRQQLDCLTPIDLERLGELYAALEKAKTIWIVAEGALTELAQAFAQSLRNMGLSAIAFHPDILEAAMRLSHMQNEDALLALGNEGPQIDLGYIVQLAHEKGVRTLCISSNGLQSPAKEAELALIISHVTSPFSGLALIAALLALIEERLKEERLPSIEKSREEQRLHLNRLLELRQQTCGQPDESLAIWSRHLRWIDSLSCS
ncbi:MAG: MurR/RpiR family transcriptional regulator [Anaerolineae bacterium]|nr:MurR/RpiR family transcriptional regulator [Anaerolineae bacterium]